MNTMRNDYFTFTDLEYILGVYGKSLHKLSKDEGLPLMQLRRNYICPKRKFFEWYDKQKAAQMHYRFHVDRVENERNVWVDTMYRVRYGGTMTD